MRTLSHIAILSLLATGVNAPRLAYGAAGGPNGGAQPSWSPDGRSIAFHSGTPNTPTNVWIVQPEGDAAPRQVTQHGARLAGWSEDSTAAYCQTLREGRSAFYAADLASGRESPMFTFLPEGVEQVARSPDGTRLVYLSAHDKHRDIWVVGWDGGNRTQLTEGLSVRSMDWSPRGDAVAFDTGGVYGRKTYVVDSGGEIEPRLVFSGVGSDPSWSPDGERLALVGMHTVIMLHVGGDTPTAERLHVSQADRTRLDWSPDGRSLAFTSVDAEHYGVSAVDVKSGEVTTFSSGYVVAAAPRWSPDGRTIAFEARRRGDCASNIWVVETQGGEARRLTSDTPSYWRSRWIDGGSSLLMASNAAAIRAFHMYRSNLDGGGFSALLPFDPARPPELSWPANLSMGVAVLGKNVWRLSASGEARLLLETEHPTWADLSPDGESFVYVRWEDHRSSIVVRRLDDDSEQVVLPPPDSGLAYSKLAWSPSGEHIAFVRGDAVCTVPAGGGEARVLSQADADGGGKATLPPVWSADGEWLAFGRFARGDRQRLAIWIVRSDGTRARELASSALGSEAGAYSDPLSLPYAWSPQRNRLAFCLEEARHPALYLTSIEEAGAAATLLRAEAAFPAWTGDGRGIAYTALDGNRERLRLYDLENASDRALWPQAEAVAASGGSKTL